VEYGDDCLIWGRRIIKIYSGLNQEVERYSDVKYILMVNNVDYTSITIGEESVITQEFDNVTDDLIETDISKELKDPQRFMQLLFEELEEIYED